MTTNADAKRGTSGRLHHIDMLRALLMLQVLPFHVGSIYAGNGDFIVSSAETSELVAFLTRAVGIFSMTGFFLISGLLTSLYLRRRDAGQWMQTRLQRLGIPFVSGLLLLSPLAVIGASWAAAQGSATAIAWGMTGDLGDDLLGAGRNWIGHLWFLPTLLIYSAAVWWLARHRLLVTVLDRGAALLQGLPGKLLPYILVLFALGFYRVAASLVVWTCRHILGIEVPALIVIDIGNWLLYLAPFLLGLMIGHDPDLRNKLFAVSWFRVLLVGAGLVFLICFPEPGDLLQRSAMRFISGATAGLTVLLIIATAARIVTGEAGWTAYVSRHAYSVYLFHYPIVVLLGAAFLQVGWRPEVEFMLISLVTFGLSFGLAEITARNALMGFIFNGVPIAGDKRPRLNRFRKSSQRHH